MRLRKGIEYKILREALRGVAFTAWREAFKHSETVPPLPDELLRVLDDAIVEDVLLRISEDFEFDE